MPSKSLQPAVVGAVRSGVAVHAASRRWPGFPRLPCVVLITALVVAGCSGLKVPNNSADAPVVYHNEEYDLTFSLPASWQGYSVLVQQWDGETYFPGKVAEVVAARGPIIVLRSPRWKAKTPRQDIPIMVFTRSQWKAQEHEKYFPYAGGEIGELWHNDKYVFGLYSRYNFEGNVKGLKEAGDIIRRNCAANGMPHLYQH